MCPSLIEIRSKTAEKNSTQTNRQTNWQTDSDTTKITVTWRTQPCIPLGSLNRVPASIGVKAGMSPLPGGR